MGRKLSTAAKRSLEIAKLRNDHEETVRILHLAISNARDVAALSFEDGDIPQRNGADVPVVSDVKRMANRIKMLQETIKRQEEDLKTLGDLLERAHHGFRDFVRETQHYLVVRGDFQTLLNVRLEDIRRQNAADSAAMQTKTWRMKGDRPSPANGQNQEALRPVPYASEAFPGAVPGGPRTGRS